MIVSIVTGMSPDLQVQWTAQQTYIALGSLLTTAALLHIDACAMEGIDLQRFDEILGLSGSDYATVSTVALGYRSSEDKVQFAKKVRFANEQVFVTI